MGSCCNSSFILTVQTDVAEVLEENFGNIAFYGNRVLQLKQDIDTAWYKSYIDLAKQFKEFMIENHLQLQWKGALKAEDFFKIHLGDSFSEISGGRKASADA